MWCIKNGKKNLVLHIDNICYNVMPNKSDITSILITEWTDVTKQQQISNNLKMLQKTDQQTTERILNAIINDDKSQAAESLINYNSVFTKLTQNLKGSKVSAFEARKVSSYPCVHIYYTLTTPKGKQVKRCIALRKDNKQRI